MFVGLLCFALGTICGAMLYKAYGADLVGKVEQEVEGVVKSVEHAAETIGKEIGKE